MLKIKSPDSISIHALREEGDHFGGRFAGVVGQFLSTPSARRATSAVRFKTQRRMTFLSTPSARRATDRDLRLVLDVAISIHALREEGDFSSAAA